MEECKCKPAKSYAERFIEYREFVELVRGMREAQKNYYKDRKIVGAKVAYKNMINKEYWVDEYLKKMEIWKHLIWS